MWYNYRSKTNTNTRQRLENVPGLDNRCKGANVVNDHTPEPQNIPLKCCTKCNEMKPATSEYFHRRAASPDGLNAKCRACRLLPPRHEVAVADGYKVCATCDETKPATTEYFNRNNKTPDGLLPWCKVCAARYRAENKAQIAERMKAYRLANRAMISDQSNAYAEANQNVSQTYPLVIAASGNVLVGAPEDYGYKLAVNGNVICTELRVKLQGNWPDYVFADGYQLKSLEEVEAHIQSENHLPGIPAAAEVEKEGIAVGDMQKKMLEKIEELTLYLIDQNKRIKQIEQENISLRARLDQAAATQK